MSIFHLDLRSWHQSHPPAATRSSSPILGSRFSRGSVKRWRPEVAVEVTEISSSTHDGSMDPMGAARKMVINMDPMNVSPSHVSIFLPAPWILMAPK